MLSNWNELLTHLSIDIKNLTPTIISKLEQWCHENISKEKDFNYLEQPEKKINQIKQYAIDFFEYVAKLDPISYFESNANLQNMNALQFCAFKGYDQFLKHIIDANLDLSNINLATKAGLTALHLAAYSGHLLSVAILLRKGADTSLKTKQQQTVMHLCLSNPPKTTPHSKQNKLKIFKAINEIAHNLYKEKDLSGDTIAHVAAQNNYYDVLNQLPTVLLTEKNNFHRSPLHMALLSKNVSSIQVLSKITKLLNTGDEHNRKPIHYAALYSDSKTLKNIMTPKLINAQDHYQQTPLLMAAKNGNKDSVILLIKNNANINHEDISGFNILQHATASLNINLIKWLLTNTDVDINQKDISGKNALINLEEAHPESNLNIDALKKFFIENGSDHLNIKNNGNLIL